MATRPDSHAAHIELTSATPEQQPILANLFELYAHDFSEFYDLELGPDGRFGYAHLPLYWREAGRRPFLLKVDGNWAGFVLVKKGSGVTGNEAVWDVAEFFILRRYRRRRIGTEVAHQLWRRFPGTWEVRVMQSNVSAQHFWECVISAFTGAPVNSVRVDHNGDHWSLFTFESKAW